MEKFVNIDGLIITVRDNGYDEIIVNDIFAKKQYDIGVSIVGGTVIDIGGYIGDFTLYALRNMGVKKVIVCEPMIENFRILRENIENNGYEDNVILVKKAVSSTKKDVSLNIMVKGEKVKEEVHASEYKIYNDNVADRKVRIVPSIRMTDLINNYKVESIDLLKIDCEGGEFDILLNMPDWIYERIRNIVFEYHRIDGFHELSGELMGKLKTFGYSVRKGSGDRILIAQRV